uniref:SCP domain-containing protein n=1 Tax=Steinernema glaseri TaxID=37863 RepID=A0A1I8AME3_9BILA
MNPRCVFLCGVLLFFCQLSEGCVSMRQRFDGHPNGSALGVLSTYYQNLTDSLRAATKQNVSEQRGYQGDCEEKHFEEVFDQRVRICQGGFLASHITK